MRRRRCGSRGALRVERVEVAGRGVGSATPAENGWPVIYIFLMGKRVLETSGDHGVQGSLHRYGSGRHSVAFPGYRIFDEGQTGVTFDLLFASYLRGCTDVELHDPFISYSYQGRNLVEFMAVVALVKNPEKRCRFRLFTLRAKKDEHHELQVRMLDKITENAAEQGIDLDVIFDSRAHDRWLRADTGWLIFLGRGLDIYHNFGGGHYAFPTSRQEFRKVRGFSIAYSLDKK